MKLRGRKIKLRWIFLITAVLLTLMFMFADMNINAVLFNMAQAKARTLAVEAINHAVAQVLDRNIYYGDLIQVTRDNDGRVTMLAANTMRMNDLATKTALAAQANLSELGAQGIKIPLGTITGINVLAGFGPGMPVRILTMGAVTTEFVTEFESAGINQTRHKIYLKATTQVRLVIPTGSEVIQVYSHVPVAESIIIGMVPETYVNTTDSGAENGVFDFIP